MQVFDPENLGYKEALMDIRTSPKGRDATEKYVEYDSDTPYIDLGSVIALKNLRCHVIWTTDDLIEPLACASCNQWE